MMEAKAIAKYVRIAPRKVRLVVDLVRGKKVTEAFNILAFVNKRAAITVNKTIKSAAYNLINNNKTGKNIDMEDIFIKSIYVDGGPVMKRIMPRSLGRAYRILKRTSHITVVVSAK